MGSHWVKILLGAALLVRIPVAGAEVIVDACELCVRSPSLAERETLKIRLENGLEAYLISDPGAPLAAAALAVEAGSWQNPEDRHGLAHFVEHLLFLGNEAYPNEGAFRSFVDDHGGRTNAYTTDSYTAYLFSVKDDALDEALDQFGHFFVNPRFDPGAMQRELNAVDEEFQRTIENDDRRQLMVLKALANPDHPVSRFAAGNALTLSSTSSEEAREWFESHYSANLMHAVVLSPRPMDELVSLVEERLSVIPNREFEPFGVEESQFSTDSEGKIVYLTPHEQRRQLTLFWELPYDHATDSEIHAADLVSFVVGHEGETSLLAQLKREGLAENIRSGLIRSRKPQTKTFLFAIEIDLTEQGLQQRDLVWTRCFECLASLRESGIPEFVHQEMATSRRLGFEYQTRQPVFEAVSDYIHHLVNEELTTFPSRSLVPVRYEHAAIQTVLDDMTPRSCRFLVTAPPSHTGIRTNNQEQWLGANYAIRQLSDEQLVALEEVEPSPDMGAPTPNPFMPNDPKVFHRGKAHPGVPFPELISDSDWGVLFFAKDEQYLVPEIAWRFRVRSEAVRPGNVDDAVLLDLTVHSILERLSALTYPAEMARLSFNLTPHHDGVALAINGFNEKALLLFEQILNAFTDGFPTSQEFERYKDTLRRRYQDFSRKEPVIQAIALMRHVLNHDDVLPSEKAKAIKRIDYQQLLHFFDAFRDRTYVEGVLFGNMMAPEANRVEELLRDKLQKQPFLVAEQQKPMVASLPKEKGPFYLVKKVKSQGNGVVLAVEQGPYSFKKRAAQQILGTGMEAPFFQELRTNQQTGYIVSSWARDLERRLFSFFAVQSNNYDGLELLHRFELFIEQFLSDLKDKSFTQERFDTVRRSLIHKLQQPPKNPVEMGDVLATLAFDHDADFDWIQKRIRGLQSLSYDEFLGLAQQFLNRDNHQRLAILVEGKLPANQTLKYHRLRSTKRAKQISSYHTRTQAS